MKLADSLNPATQAENIKKLNAGLEAVEAKIPPDYSTTETATGQKWIDGKEIYFKVFPGTFGSDTTAVVAGNIADFGNLVNCFYNSSSTVGNSFINVSNTCYVKSNGDVLCAPGSSSFYECDFNAIVYYTKASAPGRAPEDEPEEVKEPEPEEKKTTKKKTTK